ncbi:MAG: hypothetical protein JXR26_10680 [Balneolaceae bacterium]|nr:hypothetical protein [Balneolaceae bacterium]
MSAKHGDTRRRRLKVLIESSDKGEQNPLLHEHSFHKKIPHNVTMGDLINAINSTGINACAI